MKILFCYTFFLPQVSSGSLHAFESPNLSPLATVGINIHVDYKAIWKAGTISALDVHSNLCRDVVLLRLFPSIRTETIKHFLSPPIKGVVLQCYGALTKLSYVLSKDNWDLNQKRRAMDYSMRGEMTIQFEAVNPATLEIQNNKTHKLELIEQVGNNILSTCLIIQVFRWQEQ